MLAVLVFKAKGLGSKRMADVFRKLEACDKCWEGL